MAGRQGNRRPLRTSGAALLPVLSAVLTAATPLAAFAGLACAPSAALARGDVKTIDQTYCIVTADRAGVRAGNHDSFYVVTDVKKGDVVIIDGEDAAWSRVVYSSSWPAFAGLDEGTYDAAGQTFTLTRASTLLAYSSINPQYCWQALLPKTATLPAGTKLKVQGEIKDSAHTVKGYRVNAPEGARGYVESRSLRRATKEEVDAYRAKGGAEAAKPTVKPGEKPAAAPGTNPPAAPAPGADRSLVDPQVKPTPGAQPTTPPTATPPTGTPPAANPATPAAAPGGQPTANPGGPAEIKQDSDPNKPAGAGPGDAPKTDTPKPAVDRKTATLEQLESAFTKVNGKDADIFTAEYDSLLAEIQKTIGELGDGPIDVQRKRQLQLRADVLKLRIGVRDSLKKAEESKRSLNTEIKKASDVVAAAERSRVYNLVGTLTASSIYDGKNLPLMYRVVSADTKAPATLGYISPEKDPTLSAKVGQLVGVIGEAILDPTLKVSVIRPVRVDLIGQSGGEALPLLKPTEVPRSAPDAKAPEAANPAAPKTPAPAKPAEIIK